MADDDPFDEGVPRDGYGRPLIVPCKRNGEPNTTAKLKPYTRASTFAKAVSDGGNALATWKVRHAAVGVALRPDLAKMIAAMGVNPDDLEPQAKRDLDAIIERAHDSSGGNVKADYGTAVHSLTEPDPFGSCIDEQMARDVQAYGLALDAGKLRVVDAEQFIVNDDLEVAGTFDHRYELTEPLAFEHGGKSHELAAGVRLIGDKKTGSLHFDEHAIQLAIYARGKLYDHTTGGREPMDVSPQWGVLAHIPKGAGTATLYLVDIAAGWQAAKLCQQVRAWRSGAKKLGVKFADGKVDTPTEPEPERPTLGANTVVTDGERHTAPAEPEPVEQAAPAAEPNPDVDATDAAIQNVVAVLGDGIADEIARATSRDECAALWRKYTAANAWRDEHNAAVRTRLAQLAA